MYIIKIYNTDKTVINKANVTIKRAFFQKSKTKDFEFKGEYDDESKAFTFPRLSPGRYFLLVEKRGYKKDESYIAVNNKGLCHEMILFKKKSLEQCIPSSNRKLLIKSGRFIKLEKKIKEEVSQDKKSTSKSRKRIPKKGFDLKGIENVSFEEIQDNKGSVLKVDNLPEKEFIRIIKEVNESDEFSTVKEVIIDEDGNLGEVQNTIYVQFFDEVAQEEKNAFFNREKVKVITDSNFEINGYVIEYNGGLEMFKYSQSLLDSGLFEIVETKIHFEKELTAIVPPDFLFQHQWYMPPVKVTDAWEILKSEDVNKTYGSADVVISIFDSGIQTNTNGAGITNSILADFNGNVKGGELSDIVGNSRKVYNTYDFRNIAIGGGAFSLMVQNNNTLEPPMGIPSPHGVGCAGVASGMAGGNDGVLGNEGVVGAAPNARIISSVWGSTGVNTFDHAMAWLSGIDPLWWADGANYSNALPVGIQTFPANFITPTNLGYGASILSHSHTWPGAPLPNNIIQNVNNIVDYGRDKRGTLIFFSAGNGDSLGVASMAIGVHEKVFTIAASSIDQNGQEVRASYSNWGNGLVSGPVGFPNNRTDQINGIDFCAPSHYYYAYTPPGIFSHPLAPWGSTTEHAPPANRAVISGALQGLGNLPITNTSQTTLTAILTPNSIQVAAAGPGFVVGNAILIGAPNSPTAEGASITGVVGTTITLSHNLKQAHIGGGITPISAGQADARDTFGGTSSSCPLSAGIAALVLSANPNLTFNEVRRVLQSTAQPIDFRLTTDVNGVFMGWNTAGGMPIIDANDLMVINAAPAANTNVNGVFAAGATSVQLANVANLSVGQVILFGAESMLTANGVAGTNTLTLANTNNFAPGMNIMVGDGSSTHLSGPPSTLVLQNTNPAPPAVSQPITLTANSIMVGSNKGFRPGQRITIGTGANQETHTIAQLGITSVLIGGAPSMPLLAWISTGITLTANLANVHSKYDPVVLANTEPHQIQPGAIVPGTLQLVANLANLHDQTGVNPRVWVRSANCEIRIIKGINTATNTITIDPLRFQQDNSPVTGGLSPDYSVSLGYGRLDAAAAVTAALNYNHNQRDLIIRNDLTDGGLTATDVNKEIDSPDIWVRNTPGLALPIVAPNAPANYQTDGNTVHQKPSRTSGRSVMVRAGNIGTLQSFDYSLHAYVSLTDTEVENPILNQDFMRGPTRPSPNPASPLVMPIPYQITTNNLGTFRIGTYSSTFNTPGMYVPPVIGGGNVIGQVTWNQADMPALPLSFASVMLMNTVNNGNTTIQVNHTRGFKVGQTILVGLPTTANHFTATVQSLTDQLITLTAAVAGLGAMIPTGVRVLRLEENPTTIATVIAAPINTVDVADANGFTSGQYILIGPAGNITAEIKRITDITYNNGGNDTITVGTNIANPRAVGENVSRVEGKLKTFILAEVTPHDGLLAGDTPYDNNNMSCKEVFLGHKISFLDSSNSKLGNQVQVASNGADFTVDFRIRVEDPENFNTEQIQLTAYRTAANGDVETARYIFNGAGPWTLTGAGAWFTINAPVLNIGGAAATLVQQDVWLTGNFKVKNAHKELRLVISVPDTGGTFTSIESYSTQVVTANVPTGTDAEIQASSGQSKIGGIQRMFCFADMSNLTQTANQAFGPIDTNRFRLSSLFSTPAPVDVMAYAVLDGLAFVQENPANNTINLIIRPFKQAEITYTKVKYFIYRGLSKADFVDGGTPTDVRPDGGNPIGNFVDSLHLTNTTLNPGVTLTLAALDWDNKSSVEFLDDYFFSSDPNAQLPVVKRGMELGKFHNLLPTDEFGFEIVLAEGDYSLTIENAQASSTILDCSAITNVDEKRWRREQVLNYVDPAAYFGLHFYGKLLYPVIPDPDANVINSVTYENSDIYDHVVTKFFTKNTMYIDIRNEHGYSYNYDGTYTINDGSSESGNQLKIGLTPSDQTSPPVPKKYEFMEWPILVYNNAATPVQTGEETNSIYLNLGWNPDNSDPQVYVERGYVLTASNQNRFISRSKLLDSKRLISVNLGTSTFRIAGDNTANLGVGDFISLIRNSVNEASKVYRVIGVALSGGNTDVQVEAGTIPAGTDTAASKGRVAFGKWTKDIGLSFPNQPDAVNPSQRYNVAGVLKMRYFNRINPNVRSISVLNQGTQQFTVLGDIQALLQPGDKFNVRNTIPVGLNHNDGEYTVAAGAGAVTLVGNDTQITVVEAIPAGGPVNGEIVLSSQKKVKTSRYFDNIFGSMKALTRRLPIADMTIVSPTVTNILIIGDFVTTIQQNARLNILKANIPANNLNGAPITAVVLNPDGNTLVTIQNVAGVTVADTTGFIQVFYSIWKSNDPTRWITGFDRRFIDASKDPVDSSGDPSVGISYVAQTGIALETDNVIFYATPLDFFEAPGSDRVPGSIAMNGGTSTEDSFWKIMQSQNQRLKVNTTVLKIGVDEIPLYNFEDYPNDRDEDKMKENFFALCITKEELESLITAGNQNLTDYYDQYLVLRNEISDVDDNAEPYNRYEVKINGWGLLNGSVVEREISPAVPIYVYTSPDDSIVFSSKNYPNLGNVLFEGSKYYEEELRLKTEAVNILNGNATVSTIVNNFNSTLNAIINDYTAIKAAVDASSDALWNDAVSGVSAKDDRVYYWARIHMRVTIRNHDYLKIQRNRMFKMLEKLQDRSRGISSIDFSGAGASDKKVLVIGFDPYGLDNIEDPAYNIKASNVAGASAMALHGQTLNNGGTSAYIQSVIFPVRYRTMQRGDLEKMVLPFLTGANEVDMIITTSPNRNGRYDLERFAARFRNVEIKDNNNKKGGAITYYYAKPDSTQTPPFKITRVSTVKRAKFLETNIPVGNMIPGTLGNNLVIYNQQFTTSDAADLQALSTTGSGTANLPVPLPASDPKRGSTGAYLFNEAFYRIAAIRTDVGSGAVTGHISLERFQMPSDDFDLTKTQSVSDNLKQLLIDALLGL